MRRSYASLAEIEAAARRRLPKLAFDFVAGGADSEVTLRENVAAFDRLRLRPRQLVDVTVRDQRTSLLGAELETPVLIGPTGMARIAGRGGEVAGARAAGRAGTIFTLSTMSSYSIEDVAEASSGPLWFQLYLWPQREITDKLLKRVRDAGYQGLVVTVDTAVLGRRLRDVRNGFTMPPKLVLRTAADVLRHPRWLRELHPLMSFKNIEAETTARKAMAHAQLVNTLLSNPGATWDDLDRLRERWDGPVLVKGILTREDAELAVARGVDGVVVSNHGGRQLDGAPAAIDALPEVVEAVGGRAEVLLDGGVRRGSDVVKALALGARACLIGRPWLYGLAAGGADGVHRVLELLHEEIDRTLALVGRPRLSDLDTSVVDTRT